MCALHAKKETIEEPDPGCHKQQSKDSRSCTMQACCKAGDAMFISPSLPEIVLPRFLEQFLHKETPRQATSENIAPLSQLLDPPHQPPRS
jgi:hypothetical protein